MSKLRVGVDGVCLVKKDFSGVGTYFLNILQEMDNYPDIELYIFYPFKFIKIPSLLPTKKNIHYIALPPVEYLDFGRFLILWYDYLLFWTKKIYKLDLFHGINYYLPRRGICPQVLTLHHLWPPEMGKGGVPSRNILEKYINRADKIVTDSYTSKKRIIDSLDLDEKRIAVGYIACDPFFKRIDSLKELQSFRDKHGLNKKYILYVGLFSKRKNIETMLGAFNLFRKRYPDFEIVLAGKDMDCNLLKLIETLGISGVRYWGFEKGRNLLFLYNCAEFLIYIPFEEGFGLPPLEALSCGCPVLLSDIEVFHEIFADCALYCNHRNPEDVAQAMEKMVTQEGIRNRILSNTPQVIERYNRVKIVKQLIDVYREIYIKNFR